MADLAREIAIEHVLWAAGAGLLPGDVLDALGVPWPNAGIGTETVITALALAWRNLRGIPCSTSTGTRSAGGTAPAA